MTSSSSLYPRKYLSDYFLETNILITTKSCILNSFLFLVEIIFLDFLIIKIYAPSSILIVGKKM